jgi:hypothetical protein
VIHVPHIQFKFFFPAYGIAAIHLRPAGDARLHFMTARLFRSLLVQILEE